MISEEIHHFRRSLFVSFPLDQRFFLFSLPYFLFLSVPYHAPSIFVAFFPRGSVALAGLAAHLSEVRTAAELELQDQRAVGHFVNIFALWRKK